MPVEYIFILDWENKDFVKGVASVAPFSLWCFHFQLKYPPTYDKIKLN